MNIYTLIWHRRLLSSIRISPRLHLAEGGTSSATLLTDRLLDDVYTIQPKSNQFGYTGQPGYQSFLKRVIDDTTSYMTSMAKSWDVGF
jgi:hypothetical protein